MAKKPTEKQLYKLKNEWLGQFFEEVKPKEFYRAVFPEGSFERAGHFEDGKANGIITIVENDKAKNRIVFDDLSVIDEVKGAEFAVMSPVAYSGRNRTAANARWLYGIAIDLDGVEMPQLRDVFHQMNHDIIPKCTYCINSGHGLHLYYLLEKPVPLYKHLQDKLREFKYEDVMKFINDAGLLSYNIRALRINDYLKSLYRMAHLLTMSKLYREAIREVKNEIVEMIHSYVERLKVDGKYNDLVQQVKQFKLATQIFDAFGETVDNYSIHDMFTTTDTDIERQFRIADVKLGREGIGMAYGNKYMDMSDLTAFKVDVILFVADEECMNQLHSYAEIRFHGLNDDYRRYIATIDSEKIRKEYDNIVSDGDSVSKHNFRLPETIQVPHEVGGKEYRNHLFVSDITGVATMKLNTWEAGVIEEEEKREDFVCWIRNPSRGSWALCIPYEIDGEIKPTYPDFIIVRKDRVLGYVVDILEPHNPDFKDNLGKAKGFAEYAKKNPGVGRIQLIRMSKDAAGNHKFKRLDMSKISIRDKVSHAINTDEIDHIFDTDGVIE